MCYNTDKSYLFINVDSRTQYFMKKLRDECVLRGFSKQTIKSYAYWVYKYLEFIDKNGLNLNNSSVKYYFLSLKLSVNSIRLCYASIRFFFSNVLNRPFTPKDIPVKKRQRKLPKPITKQEIKLILSHIKNLKHRLIVEMLYSTGLRLQELINLKRNDIDFDNNTVFVRNGKGNKDRITVISENIKLDLLKYYSKYSFKTDYVFEGVNGKYSKKKCSKHSC